MIQNYSSTGAVINAYWTDPENNAMEVILNDSYIIDYYFNYNEGMVLYGLQGEKADQSTMLKACPAGNGSIAQCGSYYNLSEDAPGRIYLVEFVSDPNAEVIHPLPDDYDNSSSYGFLLSDTSELGLLIYNGYNAATFELAMNVRMALDGTNYRYLPAPLYSSAGLANHDEYTKSNVAVVVIPEEETAPGFFCPDCSVSIMETYTAADGAMWEITLAPNASTNVKAVQFAQYYATEGTSTNLGKFKITKGVRGTT